MSVQETVYVILPELSLRKTFPVVVLVNSSPQEDGTGFLGVTLKYLTYRKIAHMCSN